jgi:hypothetical protein
VIQREEGPLQRKFWVFIAVLTFGPIAIYFVVGFLGLLLGEGSDGFPLTWPLALVGMTMVGVIVFGSSLWNALKGNADWLTLLLSGAWLFLFGRAFLQMIGRLLSAGL